MGALVEYAGYLDSVPRDDFELAKHVQEGVRTDALEELRRSGITLTELGEIVIPSRTLKHRRSKGQRLSLEESERLLRVVRVMAFADRVFGSHEKALTWLRSEEDRLQQGTPLSALRTEAGGRVVEGMLWGISENIYQ